MHAYDQQAMQDQSDTIVWSLHIPLYFFDLHKLKGQRTREETAKQKVS